MKNKLIKTLSVLSLGSVVAAPLLTSCSNKNVKTEIHIMALNDIHGSIPGYGDDYFDQERKQAGAIRIADAMQEIADKSADTLILSGGDNNSSGKFSTPAKGATMYPVLKAMDIRYSAVGNHAWAWGDQKLWNGDYDKAGRTDKTEGKYFITSNVLWTGSDFDYESTKQWVTDPTQDGFEHDYHIWLTTQPDWSEPYKVVDLGGHKICLIGLTTTEAKYTSNMPETRDHYGFMKPIPAVHYAKHKCLKDIGEDQFNKIESFILLTHCGAEYDGDWLQGEAQKIANELDTPVDAILAGHTHKNICAKVYNNRINRPIVITQTQDKMNSFADLKINFDDSKPAGKRFKNIEAKIVTPKVAETKEEAAKQLADIEAKPRNKVVENVCKVYKEQKEVVKDYLSEQVGKTNKGLNYLQAGHKNEYLYPEDFDKQYEGQLVEQAGAFTAKAEIIGMNIHYDNEAKIETPKDYKKANIAYISNQSINKGIKADVKNGRVTLNNLYDLFPYDEFAVTGTLTYYQLEQVIRYMFTGKKPHSPTDVCQDEYKVSPDSIAVPIPDLAYPFGPNQFYGFAFDAIDASDDDKQYRKYDYDMSKSDWSKHTLKVYDPEFEGTGEGKNTIENPKTWFGADHWMNEDGTTKRYITFVMNVFDFENGNKQNKMISYFAEANGSPESQLIHRIKNHTTMDVRDLVRLYLDSIWNQKTIDMDDSICKLLTNIQE